VFARAAHRARIAWMAYRERLGGRDGFVVGLLTVGIVIVALALYGLDRAIKARTQVRRLRNMSDRLDAATVRADKQHAKHQAAEQASGALTSVMPAIERPPLTLPGTPSHEAAAEAAAPTAASHDAAPPAAASHGGARNKTGREHTGPQERRSAHLHDQGRRPSHVSEHASVVRVKPDGEPAD